MSDEVGLFLTQKEYRKDKNSDESKQSVKRLGQRVDSLQQTLNQMLSHSIHSQIVLKIMNLPDILNLKSTSLQLLLQKTPDLHF